MPSLKSTISASAKAVDPTLDALFTSSTGPVSSSAKPKYASLIAPKPRAPPAQKPVKDLDEEELNAEQKEDDDDDDDEEDSSDDDNEEEDSSDEKEDDEEEEEEEAEEPTPANQNRERKRKRKNTDNEDLETNYLDRLSRETAAPAEKRARREENATGKDEEDAPIVHESLLANGGDADLDDADDADKSRGDIEKDAERAARTVFLSNVSIKAVTDKAARKALITHLESALEPSKDTEEGGGASAKVENLRFRSVPFASASLPKRAAYITKSVMGATAQSANAYAVYTSAAAAREAVAKLNGTVILDRHLRADSVAHPSPVDHKRCVFVGNLGFVDDESVLDSGAGADGSGEIKKKRNKVPMDVEEGLWRTFGKHAGKVESVRVIRDAATRVGKGFAYVQFYDDSAVEAALLLSGKAYPPMLKRDLRVSRCKAPYKTARAAEKAAERVQIRGDREGARRQKKASRDTRYAPKVTAEQQTSAGRAAKLLGKSAATANQPLIFEGRRAQIGDNSRMFKKGGKKGGAKGGGKGGKPVLGKDASNNVKRRAARSANWKGRQQDKS